MTVISEKDFDYAICEDTRLSLRFSFASSEIHES